jgi:chromosome segregation ATPase
MNCVEVPPISDPGILAYLRIFNTNAPNQEQQQEREQLRQRFRELFADSGAHFEECDETKREQLLEERASVTEQAKDIRAQIEEMQNDSGRATSMQARLRSNLEKARQDLQEFVPINRTISSLQAIEQAHARETFLRQTVIECQASISQNHMEIRQAGNGVNELKQKYRELEAREEQISRELEELKKAPEDRGKRNSIIWRDGANVFGLQLP